MIEQSLKNTLTVFPIPGRKMEALEMTENVEDTIRAVAFDEGYRLGKEEAEEASTLRATGVEEHLVQIVQHIDAVTAQIEESHRTAIVSVLETALPALARQTMSEEVAAVIADATKGHLSGAVIIKCHPELVLELEPIVSELTASHELKVVPDEEQEPLAVTLEWDQGNAEIDVQRVIEACLAAFQQTE